MARKSDQKEKKARDELDARWIFEVDGDRLTAAVEDLVLLGLADVGGTLDADHLRGGGGVV